VKWTHEFAKLVCRGSNKHTSLPVERCQLTTYTRQSFIGPIHKLLQLSESNMSSYALYDAGRYGVFFMLCGGC